MKIITEMVGAVTITLALSIELASAQPTPPGGGGMTNSGGGTYTNYYPAIPDYGTNLWIAQPGMASGNIGGVLSNSQADVKYEILATTNLLAAPYFSQGFFLGSESTNWTPLFGVPVSLTNNLFLRVRSWASDGSGLPLWWQLQYFGTNGVDPNADPAGDGWSNIQKFQNGWNPNSFYTPPTPQGVQASYLSQSGLAAVNWQAASGPVQSYTVKDQDGNTHTVSATSFSQSVPNAFDVANIVGVSETSIYASSPENLTVPANYQVRANYAGGSSAWSPVVNAQAAGVTGSIIPGPNGGSLLTVGNVPANAATIRLFMWFAGTDTSGNDVFGTNSVDIPVADFANNTYPASTNWLNLVAQPPNFAGWYSWGQNLFLESVDTNGNVSAGTPLPAYWGPGQFFDGRVQLKQNLIFLLRGAGLNSPFAVDTVPNTLYGTRTTFAGVPAGYAFASYYDLNNYNGLYGSSDNDQLWFYPVLDINLPYEDNCLYRNYCATAADVDTNGSLTTGVFGENWALDIPYYTYSPPYYTNGPTIYCNYLLTSPAYQPTNNLGGSAPLLDTNTAQYLCIPQVSQSQMTDASDAPVFFWIPGYLAIRLT